MFSELGLILRYPFGGKNLTLVDVGAHRGYSSKPFAEKGWRVVAFEPEETNFKAFQENLKGFDKVLVFQEAVSDVNGEKVPFFTSDKYYGIHSLKSFDQSHQYAYDVLTARLDKKLADLDLPNVDFLKIDIEGADFLALKSFDFNRYSPELVMVEFMDSRSVPYFGYSLKDMVDYMKNKGYEAYVSQWDKIKEYGRENIETEPHKWLGCVLYPELMSKSFWGNLIFVKKSNLRKFDATLRDYLKNLRESSRRRFLSTAAKKLLPSGVKKIVKKLISHK